MTQKPVAVGLFLCEQVIVEERSRNVTLVNSFTRRRVEEIPWEATNFILFAVLTDGLGEGSLDVVIYALDDMEEIYERSVKWQFDNPLHELRCRLRLRDCIFPREGHYQASLLIAGEEIAQRRFVSQRQESQP